MFVSRGFTVWFTGLLGAGKTTTSNLLHVRLKEAGVTNVEVLDGDDVSTHLSRGVGFTREDTEADMRRLGRVAELLTKHRVPNLVASVSPYREARAEVRRMVEHAGGKGSFIEVLVDCPVEECERRDGSGLYARARRGEFKNFIGDDEYERPHSPEICLDTVSHTPEENVALILEYLKGGGLVSPTVEGV